nr:MAG TPA: hypothetical protein [Caudoviricetes sp.]
MFYYNNNSFHLLENKKLKIKLRSFGYRNSKILKKSFKRGCHPGSDAL